MSYNITITRNDIPANDKEAWQHLSSLHVLEEQQAGQQAADFLNLIEQLKLTFPCICDLPEEQIDDGVWADGPLSGNAGSNLTVLALVFSQVDRALPEIIAIVNQHNFVIFDEQEGKIFRPNQTGPNSDSGKKSFWQTLFK